MWINLLKKCYQELGPRKGTYSAWVEPFRPAGARLAPGMYDWAEHFSS